MLSFLLFEAGLIQAVPTVAEPLIPQGTLVRWLQLAATALVLGVVAFRFGVLRPLERSPGLKGILPAADPALGRLAWVAAGLLVIAAPLRLMEPVRTLINGEGALMDGDPTGAGSLLFQTAWGAGWWLHLVASAMALIGVVMVRGEDQRRRGWQILAGAAVLLPLAPALSGSAWVSDPRFVAVPATYLHVAAMGVWLGGLVVLLWVGIPAARALADRAPVPDGPAPETGVPSEVDDAPAPGALPALARVVNAFSRVALPAVLVLIVTGVASNAVRLGSPAALLAPGYGRVLLLKLAFVGAAFLLGFYNWRKVRPSLASNPDPGALRIPLFLELTLGVVVLLVTAVLVATPMP
jgi:putative copper export protein